MGAAPRSSARLAAIALGVMLLGAAPESARAASEDEAGRFIAELTETAIDSLTDDSVPPAERESRFRDLFRANFDVPAIGRFVLARYWRAADAAEKEAFLEVFEDVMVRRFAPQFSGYAGTRLEVTKVQPLSDNRQYIVNTRIDPPDGKPFAVDWRVRETGDGYKVLDVIGEGVSMALTLRSEYTSVIKRAGGVGGLIEQLRKQVETGADGA
jgi:phospholipid transport system substrate-binding protein